MITDYISSNRRETLVRASRLFIYIMFTIRLLTAVIFITLIAGTLVGQHQDAIWTLGYDSNGFPQNPGTDRIYFRFHDSLEIEYLHDYSFMPFRATNTSICDSAGNLLLLSNSCYIANGQEEYIENSDSLNPGYIYNNWCVGPDTSGYNSNNTALFLQNPGEANEYLLFYISTLVKLTPLVAYDDNLRLTRVNLSDQLVTEKTSFLSPIRWIMMPCMPFGMLMAGTGGLY